MSIFIKSLIESIIKKGIELIKKTVNIFIGEVTDKQLKEYTYDMVYSLHRFGCMFDEYFLMDFAKLNVKGREAFITDKIRWDYYSRMNLEENKEIFNNKKRLMKFLVIFIKESCWKLQMKAIKMNFISSLKSINAL